MRRQAAKLVNRGGKTWVVAVKAAWKDATVKERHFTTPLAVYAKRPPPPSQLSSRRVARKAKAKGSLHDKEGTVRPTHHKETYCATGSTRGRNARKRSPSTSMCGICFSPKHALPECTSKNRQDPERDTQGAGMGRSSLRTAAGPLRL